MLVVPFKNDVDLFDEKFMEKCLSPDPLIFIFMALRKVWYAETSAVAYFNEKNLAFNCKYTAKKISICK